jgi:hypothetical protein
MGKDIEVLNYLNLSEEIVWVKNAPNAGIYLSPVVR